MSARWVQALVGQHRERLHLFNGAAGRRTDAERIIIAIDDLHYEIDAYGLRYWAQSWSEKEAKTGLDALHRIGATDMTRILERALRLRDAAESCEATQAEEYHSLMQRAQLAQRFQALTREYRTVVAPTYKLLFAFMRDTLATSPAKLPGLTLPKRHTVRDTVSTR